MSDLFDLPTYVEGLETELHFATEPEHQAEIRAEIARVTGVEAAPAVKPAPAV